MSDMNGTTGGPSEVTQIGDPDRRWNVLDVKHHIHVDGEAMTLSVYPVALLVFEDEQSALVPGAAWKKLPKGQMPVRFHPVLLGKMGVTYKLADFFAQGKMTLNDQLRALGHSIMESKEQPASEA